MRLIYQLSPEDGTLRDYPIICASVLSVFLTSSFGQIHPNFILNGVLNRYPALRSCAGRSRVNLGLSLNFGQFHKLIASKLLSLPVRRSLDEGGCSLWPKLFVFIRASSWLIFLIRVICETCAQGICG